MPWAMLGATVGFGVSGIFVIGGLHLTAPHEVIVSGTLAGAVLGPAARTAAIVVPLIRASQEHIELVRRDDHRHAT